MGNEYIHDVSCCSKVDDSIVTTKITSKSQIPYNMYFKSFLYKNGGKYRSVHIIR